jgi:hypothetical protein
MGSTLIDDGNRNATLNATQVYTTLVLTKEADLLERRSKGDCNKVGYCQAAAEKGCCDYRTKWESIVEVVYDEGQCIFQRMVGNSLTFIRPR